MLGIKDKQISMGGFVLPNQIINQTDSLMKYIVTIDSIERSSGLTFFPGLDRTSITHLCQEIECTFKKMKFNKSKVKNDE